MNQARTKGMRRNSGRYREYECTFHLVPSHHRATVHGGNMIGSPFQGQPLSGLLAALSILIYAAALVLARVKDSREPVVDSGRRLVWLLPGDPASLRSCRGSTL